jgi:hypothetical protein
MKEQIQQIKTNLIAVNKAVNEDILNLDIRVLAVEEGLKEFRNESETDRSFDKLMEYGHRIAKLESLVYYPEQQVGIIRRFWRWLW